MDYEKAYKEALERAKVFINSSKSENWSKKTARAIFPELAESKDEKIRKSLLKQYKGFKQTDFYDYGITFGDVVSWFERQGEQKPAEWSEEDERLLQIVIDILDKEEHKGCLSHTDLIACVRKLKSLRPQKQWKPSEEQIKALGYATKLCDGEGEKGRHYLQFLYKLMNDLKELHKKAL